MFVAAAFVVVVVEDFMLVAATAVSVAAEPELAVLAAALVSVVVDAVEEPPMTTMPVGPIRKLVSVSESEAVAAVAVESSAFVFVSTTTVLLLLPGSVSELPPKMLEMKSPSVSSRFVVDVRDVLDEGSVCADVIVDVELVNSRLMCLGK